MKSFVNIRKLTSNLNKLGLFKVLLWHEFQNRNRTLKVEIILLKQNTAGDFDSRLLALHMWSEFGGAFRGYNTA